MSDRKAIRFIVDCIELPPNTFDGKQGVQAALQIGKRVNEPQRISSKDRLRFETEIDVTGEPPVRDFRGKVVQGGGGNRFAYLCWGWYENQRWEGFRRAKIPFRTLPSTVLEEAVASGVLRVEVKCTLDDGGPVCASVKSYRLNWTAADDALAPPVDDAPAPPVDDAPAPAADEAPPAAEG